MNDEQRLREIIAMQESGVAAIGKHDGSRTDDVYCLQWSDLLGVLASAGPRITRIDTVAGGSGPFAVASAPAGEFRDFVAHDDGEKCRLVACGMTEGPKPNANGWVACVDSDMQSREQAGRVLYCENSGLRSVCWAPNEEGRVALTGNYKGEIVRVDCDDKSATVIGRLEDAAPVRFIDAIETLDSDEKLIVCALGNASLEVLTLKSRTGRLSSYGRYRVQHSILQSIFVRVPEGDGLLVITADNGGFVSCYDLDGTMIWRRHCGSTVLSIDAYRSGRSAPVLVLAGTKDGDLLGLSAVDGKAVWSSRVAQHVFAVRTVRSTSHRASCLPESIWAATEFGHVQHVQPFDQDSLRRDQRAVVRQLASNENWLEELRQRCIDREDAALARFVAAESARSVRNSTHNVTELISTLLSPSEVLAQAAIDQLPTLPHHELSRVYESIVPRIGNEPPARRRHLLLGMLPLIREREQEIVELLSRLPSDAATTKIKLGKRVERLIGERKYADARAALDELEAQDGLDLQWRHSIGEDVAWVRTAVTSRDQCDAFVQTVSGRLGRFSGESDDGWTLPLASPVTGISLDDVSGNGTNDLFVATADGRIVLVDVLTGSMMWEFQLPSSAVALEVARSVQSEQPFLVFALQTGEVYITSVGAADPPALAECHLLDTTIRPIQSIRLIQTADGTLVVVWLYKNNRLVNSTLNCRSFELRNPRISKLPGLPVRLVSHGPKNDLYMATSGGVYRHQLCDVSQRQKLISEDLSTFGLVMGHPIEPATFYGTTHDNKLLVYDRNGKRLESRELPNQVKHVVAYYPQTSPALHCVGMLNGSLHSMELQQSETLGRLRRDIAARANIATPKIEIAPPTSEHEILDATLSFIDSRTQSCLVLAAWDTECQQRLLNEIATKRRIEFIELGNLETLDAAAASDVDAIVISSTRTFASAEAARKLVANCRLDDSEWKDTPVILTAVGTAWALYDRLKEHESSTKRLGPWGYDAGQIRATLAPSTNSSVDGACDRIMDATRGIPSLVLSLIKNALQALTRGEAGTIEGAVERVLCDQAACSDCFNRLWESLSTEEHLLLAFEAEMRHVPDEERSQTRKWQFLVTVMSRRRRRTAAAMLRDVKLLARGENNGVAAWMTWVRLRHTVESVALEDLHDMPPDTDMPWSLLSRFACAIDTHQALSERGEARSRIAARWPVLASSCGAAASNEFQRVLLPLSQLAGLEMWANEFDQQTQLPYALVDMEPMGLRNSVATVWCLAVDASGKTRAGVSDLLRRRRLNLADPAYVLAPKGLNEEHLPPALREHVVILQGEDIRTFLCLADAHLEWLTAMTSRKLPLSTISPYHSGRMPTSTVFVGRQSYLNTLRSASSGNSVILGPRKVGKTSILYQLGNITRRLKGRELGLSDEWFHPFYVDLQTLHIDGVIPAISELLEQDPCDSVVELHAQLKDWCRHHEGQVMFLMDEVDRVLSEDRDRAYDLFWQLRGLANGGLCRFVVAGFIQLYDAVRDTQSPFYNFGTELFVGPLTNKEASQLIETPFDRMGVRLVRREQCLQRIRDMAANHPGHIQRICEELVRVLDSDGSREVRLETIDRAIHSVKIEEIYRETYDRLDPLAKYLLLLTSSHKRPKPGVAIKDLARDRKLEGLGVREDHVARALRRNVLAGFMREKENKYRIYGDRMNSLVNGMTPDEDDLRPHVREFLRSE